MIAPGMELQKLFRVGERLSHQKKSDKKKRYSIHEVQVECIRSIFEKISAIAIFGCTTAREISCM